jgi:hypothetical protein
MAESNQSANGGPDRTAEEVTGRPTKSLPSRRISFENQLNILRAYAAASGDGRPVQLAEAAKLASVTANTLTLNNAFFNESRLVVKSEGGFVPSVEVISFAHATRWDSQKAPQKLAPVLRETWFAKAILSHLTMGSMEEDRAIEILADECNAVPKYLNQLKMLLDYLDASGLIARDGSLIGEGPLATGRGPAYQPPDEAPAGKDAPKPAQSPSSSVATAFSKHTAGGIQFHVDVRVDMEELAGWRADRITAFFNGIAQVLAAKGNIEQSEGENTD